MNRWQGLKSAGARISCTVGLEDGVRRGVKLFSLYETSVNNKPVTMLIMLNILMRTVLVELHGIPR